MRLTLVAVMFALGCLGCGDPDASVSPPSPGTGGGPATGTGGSTGSGTGGSASSGTGGGTASGGAGGAATGPVNALGRPRCTAPAGMSGTPQTVEDAVALLNALPKPTSVACFVESLDRPLAAYATNSMLSAQPALSTDSPRVFLKVGRMWISVVVDGPSSQLIEFGQLLDDGLRSLKGELKLPLAEAVPLTAPFDRVLYDGTNSVCGFCHRGETLDHLDGTSQIFASDAYRPAANTRVPLDHLRDQQQSCDWQAQPNRCDMLSALFAGGPVNDEEFPSAMGTFLISAL